MEVIEKDLIERGRAFDMKTPLNIFKEKIIELDSEDVSEDSYHTEKLKKKLLGHFGNSTAFQRPSDVIMPEIVFSSSIEIKDIINLASSYKERIRLRKTSEDLSGNLLDASNISEESTLYYASVIIRKALEGVESIQYQPVNPRDISLEKAESFIPDRLYTFICWIISAKQASSKEIISKFDVKEDNPSLHRYTLSLAQDMLFMKSMGEVRAPKHVGMSISCHKMTQSKIIVQMLNRHGHSISYDEVQERILHGQTGNLMKTILLYLQTSSLEFLHMLQLIIGIKLLIQ